MLTAGEKCDYRPDTHDQKSLRAGQTSLISHWHLLNWVIVKLMCI